MTRQHQSPLLYEHHLPGHPFKRFCFLPFYFFGLFFYTFNLGLEQNIESPCPHVDSFYPSLSFYFFSFLVWSNIIKLTCVIIYTTPIFCLRKRVIKNKPHVNLIHSRKLLLTLPKQPITRSCSCKHKTVQHLRSIKRAPGLISAPVRWTHSMQYVESLARFSSALASWIIG